MEKMELPFTFRSKDILTFQEQQQRMQEIANEFLNMLRDTAPAHRDDYGNFSRGRITSIIDIDWEFEYSGIIEIDRV